MDKLYNDDLNLSSLEQHDDNEIIYMTNIVDDQQRNLSAAFAPKIKLSNISMTLQLRESVYEKMEGLLNSTSKLMLDELRQEGETIQFMDVLERDKLWKCYECETAYPKDILYCEQCQCFRPIEMFKNLLHKPEEVTEFELSMLHQRRQKEK